MGQLLGSHSSIPGGCMSHLPPQITQGKEHACVLPHRTQRGAEEEEEEMEEGCCSRWLGGFPLLVPCKDGWGKEWRHPRGGQDAELARGGERTEPVGCWSQAINP